MSFSRPFSWVQASCSSRKGLMAKSVIGSLWTTSLIKIIQIMVTTGIQLRQSLIFVYSLIHEFNLVGVVLICEHFSQRRRSTLILWILPKCLLKVLRYPYLRGWWAHFVKGLPTESHFKIALAISILSNTSGANLKAVICNGCITLVVLKADCSSWYASITSTDACLGK